MGREHIPSLINSDRKFEPGPTLRHFDREGPTLSFVKKTETPIRYRRDIDEQDVKT